MKENKLLAFMVNNDSDKSGWVHVVDELDEFYRLIETDTIDIVHRRVGDAEYAIVCDDDGLLKGEPLVTALDSEYNPALVGTLIILRDGEDGALDSLTLADGVNIAEHLLTTNRGRLLLHLS